MGEGVGGEEIAEFVVDVGDGNSSLNRERGGDDEGENKGDGDGDGSFVGEVAEAIAQPVDPSRAPGQTAEGDDENGQCHPVMEVAGELEICENGIQQAILSQSQARAI